MCMIVWMSFVDGTLIFNAHSNCKTLYRTLNVYVRTIFALFLGEDLNNKARTKFQNEQLREWSEQQMKERRQADHNQKTADRLYDLKMRELDQRACELAKAEEDCRRAINVAVKDYNNALVSAKLPSRSRKFRLKSRYRNFGLQLPQFMK